MKIAWCTRRWFNIQGRRTNRRVWIMHNIKSVFNKEKGLDFTKLPMFKDLAVQRYDTFKYAIFDKLTQQQLGFFWAEEVSLQKDRNDYQN